VVAAAAHASSCPLPRALEADFAPAVVARAPYFVWVRKGNGP